MKAHRHRPPRRIPERDDPLRAFREWQAHQYDPGYWTGGRIPPFFLGPRPNPFGYLLLGAGGVLALGLLGAVVIGVLIGGGALDLAAVLTLLGVGAFAALLLASGLSLLRKGG